jgi:hypothetical protein
MSFYSGTEYVQGYDGKSTYFERLDQAIYFYEEKGYFLCKPIAGTEIVRLENGPDFVYIDRKEFFKW